MPCVFVSHASSDRAFAEGRIIPLLQELGLSTWYSRDDIRAADEWERKLLRGLESCEHFLLIMSPRSASSDWVKAEVQWAIENRWPGRIVPVLLEDCRPESFHLWMGRLQFVDFREPPEVARQKLAIAFGQPHGVDRSAQEASQTRLIAAVPTPGRPAVTQQAASVRLPRFHCGQIVPEDYFIGRRQELDDAEDIVRSRQSFLLVGVRRSGKSSFMNKLRRQIRQRPDNTTLTGVLNLEGCPDLTIETFLGHTILNIIGEICRDVFRIKPADLSRPDPAALRSDLSSDREFDAFVNINRQVVERTHRRPDTNHSPFLPHEFIGFATDLLDIVRAKGWSHFVIFYDEANHLPAKLSFDILSSNIEILNSAALTSVYAASPEMADSFRPLQELLGHEITIGPFESQRDLLQLLSRYYHGDMNHTDDLPISADALQKIWEYAAGMPFQIQFLLSFGFQNARQQGAALVTDEHVIQAFDLLSRQRPEYFSPRRTRP